MEENQQQNNNIVPNWDEARKENQKPHSIDLLKILKTHMPLVTREAADTVINAGNVKLFIDESDDNNLKNLYDKRILSLRKHNGYIDEINTIALDTRSNRKDDLSNVKPIMSIYKQDENKNTKFTKENDELLGKTIDNYFMNRQVGTLPETNKMEIERICREVRKYGTMPFKIFDENEYMSYPIIKPFLEEKYIPTEKEFKDEAKKLKVTGNFSSLGAAQNELAIRYGFKEYRAIKSRFPESSKSYDNINTILINTNKLNEIVHSEINDFFFKFRHIFRKLNLAIGILNQGNILENVEPRLYDKKLETLHIQENSLMQIYSYFLTENSILFGQIKRNIKKLSQDEKINILKDLESLEIDKKDETVFGLFVGLLEYHIGKSAGDVSLIKNEDGSIGKIFKPKITEAKGKEELQELLKELGIKQNKNGKYLIDEYYKTYNSEKGFFIYFIYNISLENSYISSLLKKMKNIPEDFEINYNQFLSVNTLNVFSMKTQPNKALLEEFEKIVLSIVK